MAVYFEQKNVVSLMFYQTLVKFGGPGLSSSWNSEQKKTVHLLFHQTSVKFGGPGLSYC